MRAAWRWSNGAMPVAAGAYLLIAIGICIYLGIPLLPDRLVVIFLPIVLLQRRALVFIRDWLPFLIVLFLYEFLRGLVGLTATRANFTAMLRVDETLFGSVPTETLQGRFFDPAHLHWWDYAATIVYLLHFVAPLGLGLTLWLRRRDWFARFAAGFLLLSFLGLPTYLAFPAAPPWLAAQHGLLHVQQVLSYTFASFPTRFQLPTIYSMFDPDDVAAVPSLHAGYAVLIALFTVRFFGWRALPVLAYPLAMSLSVVYLGEHYVGDVLIGYLFAGVAFAASEWLLIPAMRFRLSPLAASSDLVAPSRR